jgi:glycosyltransferase
MLALITATRNSMSTLPATLASVAPYRDRVKSIFVDGGSSDGTAEYLATYVAENANAELLHQVGSGLYQALNQGVLATYDDPAITHIGMLHSDDELMIEPFGRYLNLIESDPAALFYSGVEFHNSEHERVRVWDADGYSKFKLRTGWMPPHSTVVVSKRIYREHGLYDEQFGTAADYEWLVRILLNEGLKIRQFPERTMSMLVGGASSAGLRARLKANAMDGKAWVRHSRLGALAIRFLKPARKIGQFIFVR